MISRPAAPLAAKCAGGICFAFVLVLVLAQVASAPARAAEQAATSCPPGNLLAGKRPIAWRDIRGRLEAATDEVKAPEGAIWNTPLAAVLDTGAATLTWDLGATVALQAAWIQADNNDAYTLWGSDDGHLWRSLGRVGPVPDQGLRGRTLALGGTRARYLRFGEGVGDSFYAVAEIAIYCQLPTPFPPALREGTAQLTPGPGLFRYWNNESSARWELVLALLGLALLRWGQRLEREGRPGARQRLRTRLLALLGLLAALSYVNFGCFHFGNFIHDHEWTHYYLGSKYFPELAYQRLYECLSTADVEAGLRRRVELRPITNLRSNVLEKTNDVLAHPERCRQAFSPARWQAFTRDVAFFRARMGPRGWDDVQVDHGYNATPLWNAVGGALANLSAANRGQLHLLALLDPMFLLGSWAVIWWAFGWRTLAVALLVFASNFPARFYWTGGSFLRWDWLFFLVAGICCLKKDRPALAGAALAGAAGLRVFPALVFIGPALAAAWQLGSRLRRGRAPGQPLIDRGLLRLFASAAGTGALLFTLSLAGSGGWAAYRDFASNTAKHQATPLVNHMGLRTVLAWRPSEVGRLLKDDAATDPWAAWKAARLRAWHQALPLYALLAAGFAALIALGARHQPLWVLGALGVAFIPIGVELTSYYHAFIIAVALLAHDHAPVGAQLLGLTAFGQFVAWAPLRNMSTWLDEQYTLMSAATVVVLALIAWQLRRPAAASLGIPPPPP